MTPEIRYATTCDGVSIAYVAIGRGPLLIQVFEPGFANVDLIWHIPEISSQMEARARDVTLVQYDPRGFGMSDREISEFSLAAMVRDLEAVTDALGAERFAIDAWGQGSMPALAYAAAHQERVFALVLREGTGRGDFELSDEDVPLELARADWDMFTRAMADRSTAMSVPTLRQLRELFKRSAAQATFIRYAEQRATWDVFHALSRVTMPVLVTNDGLVPKEASRRLAAALPKGSFVSNPPRRGEPLPSAAAVNVFFAHAFASDRGTGVAVAGAVADMGERAELTPREIEVLRLVVVGKSGREIAVELVLSPRTVERHIANIYRKTDTHGRAQLAAFAVRHNLG
ncbi:MAG: alpha/beta fold hydrolase [Dehalococcoidia bacterium]